MTITCNYSSFLSSKDEESATGVVVSLSMEFDFFNSVSFPAFKMVHRAFMRYNHQKIMHTMNEKKMIEAYASNAEAWYCFNHKLSTYTTENPNLVAC